MTRAKYHLAEKAVSVRSALRRLGPAGIGLFIMIAAGGCEPRIDTRGFMPHPELVEQVEPGELDKFQVAQILGTPSTVSTFDEDTWYYVTQRTQNFAFFKPEIVDQSVLAIQFDEIGRVAALNRYTIEDGLIIDPVTRKTPTAGKELSIIQQLFGNVGRFSN